MLTVACFVETEERAGCKIEVTHTQNIIYICTGMHARFQSHNYCCSNFRLLSLLLSSHVIFIQSDFCIRITWLFKMECIGKCAWAKQNTCLTLLQNHDPRVAETAAVGYPHELYGEGMP